jgi:ferritin
MKTEKQKTAKSTVELLREIRDKVSAETQDMTFEQLQRYIDEQLKETIHPKVNWRNG